MKLKNFFTKQLLEKVQWYERKIASSTLVKGYDTSVDVHASLYIEFRAKKGIFSNQKYLPLYYYVLSVEWFSKCVP